MLTTPLRVAVLCSRRAPGLAHLLSLSRPHTGRAWNIVCCVTSEETFDDRGIAVRHDIPLLHHPVHRFYVQHAPQARFGDLTVRAQYDMVTARLLAPYAPDVILLAGYLLVLTPSMLDAYPSRIMNVHHSDLLLRDASGGPRYPGLRAVRDAILAGERETRCTSHLVTPSLDEGPVLMRSEPYPVSEVIRWARVTPGADDVLRKGIWAHQEWMLRSAFGPLMEGSLDLLCEAEAAPRTYAEYAV